MILRNTRQKAEGRRQKAEGRRQKAEGRRQKETESVSFIYNECEKYSWVPVKRNGADLSPNSTFVHP
jgi:hypothetical protein